MSRDDTAPHKGNGKVAPITWVIMQNDWPIGVAFSEARAQYQADSARYQWPFTHNGQSVRWDQPLIDAPPYFHVRGPFAAGELGL